MAKFCANSFLHSSHTDKRSWLLLVQSSWKIKVRVLAKIHSKSLYSLSANLPAFIFGIVIGFTGPNLELFKSTDTPLEGGIITTEEESWISSLPSFGAIASTLLFGLISEKVGRKKAILLLGVPQTVRIALNYRD